MAELIDQAYAAISRLSKDDQEAIAAMILEEIASEERWLQTLKDTPATLKKLADEARDEYRSGQTKPLDPDQL
jgi:hypothetical protein